MAYSPTQIITWAEIAQPLARIGEAQKVRQGNRDADVNLDIKLYDTRKDCQYEYLQDVNSSNLFPMCNYLLSLMGEYLFAAQSATGGGGSITPIIPGIAPDPYDFEITLTSFIASGATSKTFPASWVGFNILFVRNNITQSTVNQGASYYSWDKNTATLNLLGTPSSPAQLTELFQIYPVS
jgi:hypothetical protein